MERNRRTSLQGVVISDKMNKTIVVEVETHKKHAKYAKRVKYSNKYYAHDEKCEARKGDTVTIMACRPLSALKRWRLVSIDKKAVMDIKEELQEIQEEATKIEEAPVEEVKVEEKPAEEVKEAPAKKAPAKKAPAKKTTKKAADKAEEKGE